MGFAIHKPGQGYWTRVVSAASFCLVGFMGGLWLGEQLAAIRVSGVQPVYIQYGTVIVVTAIVGLFVYHFIGRRPRTVDFMIATEGEMKKVNWSTRREITGMTMVVIGLTAVMAVVLFVIDYLIFSPLFRVLRVIDAA
ncbi:MAG: preprotein translocase subunit SecE [Phycisphaeraceae bacterium]|nr:preprotein translocase subunit SecE [Phycisphaerales bacterium]QOJ17207.1 MAG: preprotein translocase subunit SecE [Phycisphaeraceae bacterium]